MYGSNKLFRHLRVLPGWSAREIVDISLRRPAPHLTRLGEMSLVSILETRIDSSLHQFAHDVQAHLPVARTRLCCFCPIFRAERLDCLPLVATPHAAVLGFLKEMARRDQSRTLGFCFFREQPHGVQSLVERRSRRNLTFAVFAVIAWKNIVEDLDAALYREKFAGCFRLDVEPLVVVAPPHHTITGTFLPLSCAEHPLRLALSSGMCGSCGTSRSNEIYRRTSTYWRRL
mmetsp:Transcript_64590/g.151360  ORF Transcript_64590/g.151360 Transcript_64590/m.151360 type:complete len:230 (-) Transcript_64590:332-1021(-)